MKRISAICRATKLAVPVLIAVLALLGGRAWAGAEVAAVPFEQAVQQLNSFDADSSMVASAPAPNTPFRAAPMVAEEAAPAASEDESGPADGCAPSLVNEGFFSRFKDTY